MNSMPITIAILGIVSLSGTSCAQRSAKRIPDIPVSASYDRDSVEYLTHFSQETRQMAEQCIQKAPRPELTSYCKDVSTREQARIGQLQSWLMQWYQSKPDPAKQEAEHASEELEHFLNAMRSSVGEKFEQEFLPGLRLHMHDGLAHTAECQTRATRPDYRRFCATWNGQQEEDRKRLSAWICQWFRDCVER